MSFRHGRVSAGRFYRNRVFRPATATHPENRGRGRVSRKAAAFLGATRTLCWLAHFRGSRVRGKKRASTVGGSAVMAGFVPGVKQTRRRVWLRCIADGCLVAVLLSR